MSSAVAGKINSHNEWDKLREIIVGTAEGSMAVLTWNRPEPIPENVKEQAYKIAKKRISEMVSRGNSGRPRGPG
jgi:hypothetical protein